MLGLGTGIVKSGIKGIENFGIVTNNLVLNHSNYNAEPVTQVSTGAASFNLVDAAGEDNIDLGSIAGAGQNMSACAWTRLTISDNSPIIRFGDFLMRYQNSTQVRVFADVGTGGENFTVTEALNEWVHIAATVTISSGDSVIHVYRNGVSLGTQTQASAVPSTDSAASKIGRYTSNYLRGYLCNVGVWQNKVLSQAEIKSIMWKDYSKLTFDEKSTLTSWWNLDEETNTSGGAGTGGVKDHHGSNHGTLA